MVTSFSITRGIAIWDRLNSSFWFVPALMVVVAVALSFLLIEVDTLRDVGRTDDANAFYTFGPRVLDNFMRDRSNQIVLGTFIATFLYCLFVLRSVRGMEGASFVPHLAVGFGVVLAAASVAVLIYFIHHIATSIRIETLLAKLAREGCAAVDCLFDERPEQGAGYQMRDGFDASELWGHTT
ncbi:DUF2254 family protein [Nisaea sp.]|uniref:DUF2254 family protein n=1 Tax=Nisaea sp. TaxID=2024842 RepID=UPI0032645BD3